MIKLCQHFTHVVYNCPHYGFKDIQVVCAVPQFVCRLKLVQTCLAAVYKEAPWQLTVSVVTDLYCPFMFHSNSVPIPVLLAPERRLEATCSNQVAISAFGVIILTLEAIVKGQFNLHKQFYLFGTKLTQWTLLGEL